MSAIFLKVLNMSINASWLILVVIVARFLFKKAPKWINCLLWGLVAIRLICPFSMESALSLLPSSEAVPESIIMEQKPQIDSGVTIIDNAVNSIIENNILSNGETSINSNFDSDVSPNDISSNAETTIKPMQSVVSYIGLVWLVGMAVMIFYAITSFVMVKRRVRASIPVGGNIRECDEVKSPFILGIIRPMIYVPSGMSEQTLNHVIAHEEAHIRRHDHWWKPLGFMVLAVYWFNPLVWVAYILLCRDIEAACDERVIRDRDRDYMASYSQALLDCSNHRRVIAVCPLSFGETGVKTRVRGVLNYKKPAFWVIMVGVTACAIIAGCFLTSPKKTVSSDNIGATSTSDGASNENDSEAVQVEIKRPTLNLSAAEGADPTQLLFADKDRIIFSGYYGLFVYSKSEKVITNAVDLISIGCNYTQGDNCCMKYVSADGNMIYLHPMGNSYMYVYNIQKDILVKKPFEKLEIELHEADINEQGEYFDVWENEGQRIVTYLDHGYTIGDVGYIDYWETGSEHYPFFASYGLSSTIDFSTEE